MKNNFLKFIGTFAVANIIMLSAQAQNAKEVSTKFEKDQKTAFQADYKVSKDIMKATLIDRFKKAGIASGKKASGFTKYEGITFSELSANKIDVYTKVEGKKDNAVVVMLVSSGYDNFISTATDAATAGNTITFLNKLNDDAANIKAGINLAAQEKIVKKAEESFKKSEKQNANLVSKKANLEKQIAQQAEISKKASQVVETEKLRLDNLKGLIPNK